MNGGGFHRPISTRTARGGPGGLPALFRAAAAAMIGLAVAGSACVAGGEGPLGRPVRQGTISAAAVRESSGVVASRKHPGVYWTLNDSGGGAVLYAMDARGKHVGRVSVIGARNIDWEDIATDAAGRLHIADVGDNSRRRPFVVIYTLPEPDPREDTRVKVASAVRVSYPKGHGPQDCEALFVRGGWAYLISKELPRARLYGVKLDGAGGEVREAAYLGTLPAAGWITAADISPDGRRVALLSYSAVYAYDLAAPLGAPTSAPAAGTLPARPIKVWPRKRVAGLRQAEAICWALEGGAAGDLLITNEQREVYRIGASGGSATRPAARSQPGD